MTVILPVIPALPNTGNLVAMASWNGLGMSARVLQEVEMDLEWEVESSGNQNDLGMGGMILQKQEWGESFKNWNGLGMCFRVHSKYSRMDLEWEQCHS